MSICLCYFKAVCTIVSRGIFLIHFDALWKRRREAAFGLGVLIATVLPALIFEKMHYEQGSRYFANTTWLRHDLTIQQIISGFFQRYQEFFSTAFLFERGDTISRHHVREFGQLLKSSMLLIPAGIVYAILSQPRFALAMLLWAGLYPVGATLMNEIPSATRAFPGAVCFAVLSGLGGFAIISTLARLTPQSLRPVAQLILAVIGASVILSFDFALYWNHYANEYPKYSAPTYGGFQFGYRQAIAAIERERLNYDQHMMTATEVNQPQIFSLFYTRLTPQQYQKTGNPGHLILDPAEYGRYELTNKRTIYALRPSDLLYFSEHTVKERVTAPGGQVEFVVAEVRKRKSFVADWDVSQPLAYRPDNLKPPLPELADELNDRPDIFSNVSLISSNRQFRRTDLNSFLASANNGGNPEEICVYLRSAIVAPSAQPGTIEVFGSEDKLAVWVNGRLAPPGEFMPKRDNITAFPAAWSEGENQIVVRSCEGVGDWYFNLAAWGQDRQELTPGPDNSKPQPGGQ